MLLYYFSHTLRSFGVRNVLDSWLVAIKKKKILSGIHFADVGLSNAPNIVISALVGGRNARSNLSLEK